MIDNPDYLIVGAGIVGASIAFELKKRFPQSKILVIEKEPRPAMHGSGRNSGVLHAGFYYTADSLKAKFTRDGNQFLREFCAEKSLPINQCGKLVVPQDEADFVQLDELLRRAASNNVELFEISDKEAKQIEPRVKTCGRVLYSPTTATVDPIVVTQRLIQDAREMGVQFEYDCKFINRKKERVRTSRFDASPGFVINAAGLYADNVARQFGFSKDYRILPFKGLYLYSSTDFSLRTNIYPVPNLKNPFLGVHFTVTVDGKTKIGPTAIPALWRENYRGLDNFRAEEFFSILLRELNLFASANFDFRTLAIEEIKKYSKTQMVRLAGNMISNISPNLFRQRGKVGIRAQLVNIKKKTLEMDFVVEHDHKSLHILNAVSPAFTASMPFARYICDKI